MFNINQFLERLRKVSGGSIDTRGEIARIIKEKANIELQIEAIEIKPPRISLKNISQAARSEIYIKKHLILEEVNRYYVVGTKKPFTEIR